MKQAHFENFYAQEWQDFETILLQIEQKRRFWTKRASQSHEILSFAKRYRRLCHYLSMAKERGYSSQLVDRLNDLVTRGHSALYHHKPTAFTKIIRFFFSEFPFLVRREWKWLLLAGVLFWGSFGLTGTAVYLAPDFVHAVFSPQEVSNYESMYDDASDHRKKRDSESYFTMFGFYILNNIGIGFRTFASGLLFGLGSVFFLVYNGIAMGAVSGHMLESAYTTTFFSFVVGHGSFELTAIVLSGAAGLKLGAAIISPGRLRRIDSLKKNAAICMRLVYGIIAMFVIAACIEAFWSPAIAISANMKFAVGGGLWLFVLAYLLLLGRDNGTQPN